MKISVESELMKNQKHADVMAPDLHFDVLQTPAGETIFISIGTDKVLYATRELAETTTGWTRLDLSSVLLSFHAGAKVAAKLFAASQNPKTMTFDIALIITVAGADFLYLCQNHSNDSKSWETGISWTQIPFDCPSITAPNPMTIADVNIMSQPASDGGAAVKNIFVDIIRSPNDPMQLLDRYYIQPKGTPRWNRHTLAIDLKAGSVSNCLGNRTNDFVPGIYTFGAIETTQELIFTPQYNWFRPEVAPSPARLTLPGGTTSIASALGKDATTNLFVAATDGLYVFQPDNQHDQARAVHIVSSVTFDGTNIFSGISSLSAATLGKRTVVWGLNTQGDLVQCYCPAGSEGKASAWSVPIPIITGVEGFAFYLNVKHGNNVLFAHISGQNMVQLTQDPITTTWHSRNILLPTTKIDDFIEYNSFTSHIRITNDNRVPLPDTTASLTSTSPVPVYVNGIYHTLTPTTPITVKADDVGNINVVQETQSLSAVCFKVTVKQSAGDPVSQQVDPSLNTVQKLSSIKSGNDLSNAKITNSDGTSQPLVPSSVSTSDKNAAAKCIANLLKVKATLPADGSVQKPAARSSASRELAVTNSNRDSLNGKNESLPQSFGFSNRKNGFTYHEDEDALQNLKGIDNLRSMAANISAGSIADQGITYAGDLLNSLKSLGSSIEEFVVSKLDDAWQFVVTIAGKVYSAILDCASTVISAMEFVFSQIKVFFEELLAWLGFLFNWNDILRTHAVMKNYIKQYLNKTIGSIDTVRNTIDDVLNKLEDSINAWANIKDPGQTVGNYLSSNSSVPGQNSPQSNWASQHARDNYSVATTSANTPASAPSVLTAILNDLEKLVADEEAHIMTAVTQVKDQVAAKFESLTIVDIIKKLLAIVGDLVLKTAKNFIDKLLDIVKIVVTGIFDLLDHPLDIPIISPMYETITNGAKLSFLDLFCLLSAVPATVVFKAVTGQAPFADNTTTKALISASSFKDLKSVVQRDQIKGQQSRSNMTPPNSRINALAANDYPIGQWTVSQVLGLVFGVAAGIGACFEVHFNRIIWGTYQNYVPLPGSPAVPLLYRLGLLCSHIIYCSPNFASSPKEQDWTNISNEIITGLEIIKAGVDATELIKQPKVSASLETVLNGIWLVPAIAASALYGLSHDSDKVALAATLAFDVSGVLTVATDRDCTNQDPRIYGTFRVITCTLTICSGILYAAAGITAISGK